MAFYAVAPTGLTANARLVPVADGTDIELVCVYPEGDEPTPGGELTNYAILVVDRNGQVTEVERWPVKPNKQMTPSAHTDLKLSKIRSRRDPGRHHQPAPPPRPPPLTAPPSPSPLPRHPCRFERNVRNWRCA